MLTIGVVCILVESLSGQATSALVEDALVFS